MRKFIVFYVQDLAMLVRNLSLAEKSKENNDYQSARANETPENTSRSDKTDPALTK